MTSIALAIKNISLTVPGDRHILSKINYTIYEGDFIVILGSNGSGKSSLLKLLARQYTPTTGHIDLYGKPLIHYSNYNLNQTIITLTQNFHESLFTSLTLLENAILAKQRQESKLFSIAKKNEREFFSDYLKKFNANLPHKLDQTVEKLSGGEKQALALALSVLYPPRILLLDEHTSALDPKAAEQVMSLTLDTIKKNNMTCILTTHDLDIAMHYGNRILALKHGEIFTTIDHEKKSALDKNELLAACY